MKFPNLDNQLPSSARSALVEFYLTKLRESKPNCYNEPSYRLVDALHDSQDASEYIQKLVVPCFELAYTEYKQRITPWPAKS